MANDYNNKRYYWIKLRDTFMTSDAVDFLMGQKDGANYVVLYQMLCLKTINTDGELSRTIGEVIIPYDIDKIVRDTKWFTKDTVIVALGLYQKLGLIFKNDNGNLVITNFNKMVGSESQSAIYKQDKKELENFQLNSNRYKDIKILDIKSNIDKDNNNLSCIAKEIIDYMNELAQTQFKYNTKKTLSLLNARLKEGFTKEHIKDVIYFKYNEWYKEPYKFSNGVMSDTYYRPNTLFGTKFEEYLERYNKEYGK